MEEPRESSLSREDVIDILKNEAEAFSEISKRRERTGGYDPEINADYLASQDKLNFFLERLFALNVEYYAQAEGFDEQGTE